MPENLTRISSTARTAQLVGDAWTLLILQAAFRGARQYSDWTQELRVPRPVLTHRLNRLISGGLFEKHLYCERPVRYEYRLTEMGTDLWRYLLMIWDWEVKWSIPGSASQRRLKHFNCRQYCHPIPSCNQCGTPVNHRNVLEAPGPGAGIEPRVEPRWQRATSIKELGGPGSAFSTATAKLVGSRWNNLIIYAVARGLHRFGEIEVDLSIGSQVLSQRLSALVEDDILSRSGPDSATGKPVYELSPKGWSLYQTRLFAIAWGDRWLGDGNGPPTVLTHSECGKFLTSQLRCSACGDVLCAGEFNFDPSANIRRTR